MADEIELTEERESFLTEKYVQTVAARAKQFDPGQAGECDFCGEDFPRVIRVEYKGEYHDSCGRCRDKRGIA